jgi:Anti-sigma-K factor rskA
MSSAGGPRHDCEWTLDAASYVLGALDESAMGAFTEHLSACASCREEVAELQPAADALALAAPRASAPRELRARIMAPVHAEAELLKAAGHEADRPAPARSGPRFSLAPALSAAVALAAGLLIGAFALGGGSGTKVQVIPASVIAPGHRASAVLRENGTHLELVVVGMPAPPPGHIYEVWLERGTQAPAPTDALFSVTRDGDGAVDVPGDASQLSHVLVTAEPLGGTLKPTRAPVIEAKV